MILRVFTFMLCSLASPGRKDSLPCRGNAYLGTKTLYRPQQPTHTPPPPGYLPVFINYVGRHGARFLTGEGADAAILKILSMAAKEDALTAMGHRLKDSMTIFIAMEKNNYGNITAKGMQEQAGIGERMRKEYPSVFRGNGLTIVTTEAVRTRQSEAAFLKGLGS